MSVLRKILETKIQVLEKLSKIYCFYQIVLWQEKIDFKNKELLNDQFKMNKINKLLLTGDKFMPELNLKQPGFTFSACGRFTKHCEKVKKCRETRI